MKSSKIIENHLKDLQREAIPNLGITVGLIEKDNIYEWKFTMLGPKDTPYKGGLFKLKIKFPKDFPLHAPSIYFINPIYHVNVNSDSETGLPLGLVGFDTLYNWKKETGVREILTKLFALFYWPNPDSSFSLNKANEFKNDFSLYEAKIENFCKKYATPLKQKENYNALDWKFNEFKNFKIKQKIERILLLLNKKEFKDLINRKEYNYDKEKNSEKKLDYLRNQILKYFNQSLNLNLTGKEKKLDLSYKNIENDELNLFCQIEFTNLEEINLSHNKIFTINPLINFKKLKIIDLSYNRIENDFCGLAELLKNNKLLEKINLNNNNLKIGNNIKKALSEIKKEMVIINQNININDEKIFKKEDEKETEKEPEKVLVKLNFSINGKSEINLQCNDNELVEDVLKKVCTESRLKYTKILIIYNSKNIKLNQTLRQNRINGNKKLTIITDVTFGF